MKISLGLPKSIEAEFMFAPLLEGKVQTKEYKISPVREDIFSLNDRASRGQFPLTVVDAGAIPHICGKYAICSAGGVFAEGAGPKLVSREPLDADEISGCSVAIAGMTSSAYVALAAYKPLMRTRVLPADKVLPAVNAGLADCAVLTGSDRMIYENYDLYCIEDLGKWWAGKFGSPLPMSCLAVEIGTPPDARAEINTMIAASIRYALSHRAEAIESASRLANDLDINATDEYIREHVGELSIDMQQAGRNAIEKLIEITADAGIISEKSDVTFTEHT